MSLINLGKARQIIAFLYGLSSTDLEIVDLLFKRGPLKGDEIASLLGLSKVSLSKSFINLVNNGFVVRERVRGGLGKPAYVYRVDKQALVAKLLNDVKTLSQVLETWIKETYST